MVRILLIPPIAFSIYLVLVAVLSGFGHVLAGKNHPSALKSSIYASGEAQPRATDGPGYGSFFGIALLFAVLHLGALVIGISGAGETTAMPIVYVVALILVLAALVLG